MSPHASRDQRNAEASPVLDKARALAAAGHHAAIVEFLGAREQSELDESPTLALLTASPRRGSDVRSRDSSGSTGRSATRASARSTASSVMPSTPAVPSPWSAAGSMKPPTSAPRR